MGWLTEALFMIVCFFAIGFCWAMDIAIWQVEDHIAAVELARDIVITLVYALIMVVNGREERLR